MKQVGNIEFALGSPFDPDWETAEPTRSVVWRVTMLDGHTATLRIPECPDYAEATAIARRMMPHDAPHRRAGMGGVKAAAGKSAPRCGFDRQRHAGHGVPQCRPETVGEKLWLAYQRGKQYRIEKQQGQRTDLTSGNESQKPCPKLQTADRIASVSGVSPRTIKNDGIRRTTCPSAKATPPMPQPRPDAVSARF